MDIKKNVAKAKKFITKNPVLPVLENIVISPETGTVTNLRDSYVFQHEIPVKGTGYIPFEFFEKAVNKLKTIDSIGFNEGNVTITSGRNIIKCYVKESLEDFPILMSGDILSVGEISFDKDFKIAQSFTLKPSSKDTFRDYLGDVLVDTDFIVGTDAHTLCFLPNKNKVPSKFTLPRNAFFLEGKFNYHLYGSFIEIYNDSEVFIFKLPTETYPDYKSVLPKDNPNIYEFSKQELIDVLSVLSLGSNPITKKISFKGGKFTSCDIDLNTEVSVEINNHLIQGEFIDYSVNGDFLLKILKSVAEDKIVFECSSATRGAILNNYYLIMPLF